MASGVLDRLAVGVLEGIGRRLWGFPPLLMPPVVEELGPVRSVAWFATNMPPYQRTLRRIGPLRTHLVCVTVSLLNGCRYCAVGHARALELIYLRDRGRLFPREAEALAGWIGLPPAALRERLSSVLHRADLPVEVLWVDRTLAMATGAQQPIDPTEARIAHLVRMLGVLNAVGVASATPPDEAHDPINKDDALKREHQRLRSGAGVTG
ncbi:hypothetical protein [Pseudonocardia asaccharolytica]|uniref:Carboxymuconolactone decarboxylase-like domain-containing protein n=1 Tax=Pseudonocardia asaccharolytica DSM 44247 = NBRC 16224 TaxID=1123024 RepID=A0A511D0K9_9PSEU|nr:hypothetical protein [Pseudonocardia asaccharolytica]GEL18312.1 hypothetical protein PA7_21490 [Pseudonocardia asaccharolytica DSM 44247 = NBRC 16224]